MLGYLGLSSPRFQLHHEDVPVSVPYLVFDLPNVWQVDSLSTQDILNA